jgi:peptidyl-prolyl cis-trans isomerase C
MLVVRMINYSKIFMVIILAMESVLCTAQTSVELIDKPLAKDGSGVIITVNDILSEVNKMPLEVKDAFFKSQDHIKQIVNNLLVRRVLAAEAERLKLSDNQIARSSLMVAIDRVLSDLRLAQMDKQNEPSNSALESYAKTYYKAHPEKYQKPEQFRASHILINKNEGALEKVNALITQLRKGESFSELAKVNSIDTGSAIKGGDLGYFTEGKMVKPFENAVKALGKVGDISEAVETQFGYHIIRLDERIAKATLSYDEVEKELLKEARVEILSEKRISRLREISKGIIFDQNSIDEMSSIGLQLISIQK